MSYEYVRPTFEWEDGDCGPNGRLHITDPMIGALIRCAKMWGVEMSHRFGTDPITDTDRQDELWAMALDDVQRDADTAMYRRAAAELVEEYPVFVTQHGDSPGAAGYLMIELPHGDYIRFDRDAESVPAEDKMWVTWVKDQPDGVVPDEGMDYLPIRSNIQHIVSGVRYMAAKHKGDYVNSDADVVAVVNPSNTESGN